LSATIRVTVLPSRWLGFLILFCHFSAAVACFLATQGVVFALVLAGVLLSGGRQLALAMQWTRDSIVAFSFAEDGTGEYWSRDGASRAFNGVHASWVSPIAIVLGFKGTRAVGRWLVLLPDACDADTLRMLRRRLLWESKG
jgi:hypothetical protein